MSELAAHETDYDVVEGEPPDLLGRNLNSAAHLLASATAFFFLAFVFAYFYLRSLNNAQLWQPKDVDPSIDARHARDGADRRSARSSCDSASPTSAPVAGRVAAQGRGRARCSGSARSCCRSSSGRRSASGRRTAAMRASSSAGRRSTSSSSRGRCSGSRTLLATAIRYRTTPSADTPAPGHASGDPGRLDTMCRSALAPPARSRGVVLLLDVPGRARRPGLDHPLPALARATCRADEQRSVADRAAALRRHRSGALYWLGGRRRSRTAGIERPAKDVAFYLGLARRS